MRAKRSLLDSAREHARKSTLAILASRKGSGITREEADAPAAEAVRWVRRRSRKHPKPRG